MPDQIEIPQEEYIAVLSARLQAEVARSTQLEAILSAQGSLIAQMRNEMNEMAMASAEDPSKLPKPPRRKI